MSKKRKYITDIILIIAIIFVAVCKVSILSLYIILMGYIIFRLY